MFNKILVANRGEIACRVIRTAREMGIGTVAVYSNADRNALHVQLADEAVALGGTSAQESYLRADLVLEAARHTGAEAVHPGYGFLSENPDFSRDCEAAGISFIGPSAEAIEIMGSKSRAKQRMTEVGVPVLPGYHGDDQSLERFAREAEAMGYPVLLKAAAGGGGKGMRRVDNPGDLESALAGAQRESAASFGGDTMLLEKLLLAPRHIEVQVFCDSHGNAVYLFERDCSSQRRHQKIIEEAPASGLDESLRRAMGDAAVRAARAIDYRGAGTIEFLFDAASQSFFFMEMNTRLQVEHPVTEMITGQDLVAWQLAVAAGGELPFKQAELTCEGHAFEARVYAEDPDTGFLPETGTLTHFSTPQESCHVRIDTGVREGDVITPYYDPMIAKLIVWDTDRASALRRLRRALSEFRIAGLTTNIPFLYNLAVDENFVTGGISTRYVEDNHMALTHMGPGHDDLDRAMAGLYLVLAERHQPAEALGGGDPFSPWGACDAWRIGGPRPWYFNLQWHDQPLVLRVERAPVGTFERFQVWTDNEEPVDIEGYLEGERLHVVAGNHRFAVEVADDGDEVTLFAPGGAVRFNRSSMHWQHDDGHGGFEAPINGTVVQTLVEPGQPVSAGAPLLVMEAMKMEHTIDAPAAGHVSAFHCKSGDLVSKGQNLLEFETDEESKEAVR